MSAAPFIFFDLRTPDADRSRAFYRDLAGLTVDDVPAGSATIPMFVTDGEVWGGLTELPQGDSRPPQWIPYLPVEDVDDARERATALGATVVRERTDLPAGSVVVIADPGGATVALWQATHSRDQQARGRPGGRTPLPSSRFTRLS